MIRVKHELLEALANTLTELAPDHKVMVAFESPKQPSHGDLACTAAMQLAKPLRKSPRALAQDLVASLRGCSTVQRWVDSIEVAVIPVLLGGGLALLPNPAPRAKLKLAKHRIYPRTGTVSLEYVPA